MSATTPKPTARESFIALYWDHARDVSRFNNVCEERLAGKKLDDRTCTECHSLHARHRATLAAFVATTRQVTA